MHALRTVCIVLQALELDRAKHTAALATRAFLDSVMAEDNISASSERRQLSHFLRLRLAVCLLVAKPKFLSFRMLFLATFEYHRHASI